jgi:hypothetical protein
MTQPLQYANRYKLEEGMKLTVAGLYIKVSWGLSFALDMNGTRENLGQANGRSVHADV